MEPDTEPLKLQSYADIQAFLFSEDELEEEIEEEEILADGDDVDEDPQPTDTETKTPSPKPEQADESSSKSSPDLKRYDNTLPLSKRQLVKYLRKVSRVLFNRLSDKQL